MRTDISKRRAKQSEEKQINSNARKARQGPEKAKQRNETQRNTTQRNATQSKAKQSKAKQSKAKQSQATMGTVKQSKLHYSRAKPCTTMKRDEM